MRPGRGGPICGPERTKYATQGPAREEVSSLVWGWLKAGTFETHANTLSRPQWDQGTAVWGSFVSPRLPPTLSRCFWPPTRPTSLSLEKILRWQDLRYCHWGFPWSPFLLEVSVQQLSPCTAINALSIVLASSATASVPERTVGCWEQHVPEHPQMTGCRPEEGQAREPATLQALAAQAGHPGPSPAGMSLGWNRHQSLFQNPC